MSIKQAERTTGPPGSYVRLKHMTSLAFGFRDPGAYLIAKEVLQAVDAYLAGDVYYLDLNAMLRDCADDVITSLGQGALG